MDQGGNYPRLDIDVDNLPINYFHCFFKHGLHDIIVSGIAKIASFVHIKATLVPV